MDTDKQLITVCVCTYKRPQLLARLLSELRKQATDGLFTLAAVVVDNDHLRSAEAVVHSLAAGSTISINYCVEPRQSIARARNRAVAEAGGDFVAFIDDDEFPADSWLLNLFRCLGQHQADGVLGPVRRYFEETPPDWLVKSPFYVRREHPTGTVIGWKEGRTGNVLLKRSLVASEPEPFRPEFRGGEDLDFFRRMIDKGHVFVWCNEAVAYEVIPRIRWSRMFLLKRALLRGAIALNHPESRYLSITKSIIATFLYLALLPFLLPFGQHRFMPILVKLFDHLGKLLAYAGINPIKGEYITE